jgi:hypothetical protein
MCGHGRKFEILHYFSRLVSDNRLFLPISITVYQKITEDCLTISPIIRRLIMRRQIRLLGELFVCVSIAFTISSCNSTSSGEETISLAERAMAILEVQNVFSKHCYYHEMGKHRAEMESLWVSKDGEYADTVKWTNPQGIWKGYDAVWNFYVAAHEATLQQTLDEISSIYPSIQNVPENLGIGGEWASHLQTTPVIEVAGDGLTAKGVWYSPGLHMTAQISNGNVSKSGSWFWEKYGVDFVKEDGKWKIWHISIYYENTAPGWNADTNNYYSSAQTAGSGSNTQSGPNLPSPTESNPDPYKAWSPTKLPEIEPQLPEPYYTFSETFSY